MPTDLRAAPLVLAGVLLLAACGTQSAGEGAGSTGGPVAVATVCPSDHPQYGDLSTEQPSEQPRPSGTPTPLPVPSYDDAPDDGVKITGLYAWGAGSGCGTDPSFSADFEITNDGTAAATYTVTFGFRSGSGTAVDDPERTIAAVGAGKTVKGTVVARGSTGTSADVSSVTVVKVRSVPVDEAPSQSGPCPESGVRVYADRGDAAMGLRVVGLHLVNCGSRPYEVNGYPEVEVLDEDHETVDEVKILQGTDQIGGGLGGTAPQPLVLQPGETAQAGLAWRNTTEFGDPVNAPYVRVRPRPGAAPVMVTPELDLGTTGRLGVDAWTKETVSAG
ncbi:DUF4232 domain-containing protein [Streptomyces sp. TRM68416]|uniref:DUF4232 domain-containing protein n=1 Tax=Streptomyces sp. TRM68416 TaxID=2758412 RepID=UPI001661E850|nr:DUF4232 domain-containing protein [Streptomyces sp. TRM68416]MBD0841954.1 DUF4232 domain-containing protein [Streptomyces sp. TRM68416]